MHAYVGCYYLLKHRDEGIPEYRNPHVHIDIAQWGDGHGLKQPRPTKTVPQVRAGLVHHHALRVGACVWAWGACVWACVGGACVGV